MSILVKALDQGDIDIMHDEMRPMDRMEFAAMSSRPLATTLSEMLEKSEHAKAFYFDGKLVAIWGVMRRHVLCRTGHPWLAATAEVTKPAVRRVFLKHGKEHAAMMTGDYDFWWNCVAEQNTIAIRWLKWLGFHFTGQEYVTKDVTFLYFELKEE